MSFKHTLSALSLIALATFPYSLAQAQQPSARPYTPAGEGPSFHNSASATSGKSDRSRASVKAATRRAEAAGTMTPAGEAPLPAGMASPTADKAMASNTSTKRRAVDKNRVKAARKDGTMQPAGEAPQPLSDKPMK